jgi:polysaccharide export outer membrane protein
LGSPLAPLVGVGPPPRAGARPALPWAAQADLYRLGPGDGLSLSFLDPSASMVSGPVTILADGTATLAMLGSVQLTGLTIGQARVWLRDLYGEYLLRPDLTLSLVTPRPVKVTALGEVEKPGLYSLTTISATPVVGDPGGRRHHLECRCAQGQPAAPAPGRSGRVAASDLNLAALLQSGDQRQNPLLFDGDTIAVGRIDKPVPEEIFALGLRT